MTDRGAHFGAPLTKPTLRIMTKEQRDEITTMIHNKAKSLNLWHPKMMLNGLCHRYQQDPIDCGEVYADFWHVKIFDDGTFQIGWLEWGNNGTCLRTKPIKTIEEVYAFLSEQR